MSNRANTFNQTNCGITLIQHLLGTFNSHPLTRTIVHSSSNPISSDAGYPQLAEHLTKIRKQLQSSTLRRNSDKMN
jgi:hypothetical protein